MQFLTFFPAVDLPLIVITTIAFVVNFHLWTKSASEDLRPYLRSRLLGATLRVIGFFAVLLFLCWYLNLAVWCIFVIICFAAISGSVLTGESLGLDLAVVLTCGMLREWCFGFPQLILRPQPDTTRSSELERLGRLIGSVGITTSPLRPAGNVEINGDEFPAASEGGTLIDKGEEVVVVATKSGAILVRTLAEQAEFE